MEQTGLLVLFPTEAIAGLLWGAGGGIIVAIVSRSTASEALGRVVVGGIVAAASAPYFASEISMSTSSASYPFVCCSLGVLGFQLVKAAIEQPDRIPVVGRLFPAPAEKQVSSSPSLPQPPALPLNNAPVPSPSELLDRLRVESDALRRPSRPRVRVPIL